MKRAIFICFSVLIFFSCSEKSITLSEHEDNDWNRLQLKGKVKAIKEIKFLAVDDFSEIVNGEKVKHIYNKEFLFNLDGFSIEQNDYIPDGTLANRIMYLYQDNKLIEYNEYDSQGLLFGTGKYELGENGSPKELNYRTNDGRFNWSEKFTYDENGNMTELSHIKGDNVIEFKQVFEYDESGLLLKSELYKEEQLFAKNNYKNDTHGSQIEMNYGGDESNHTYMYNYDSKGNWTKKIVFENKNPSGILVREIEYFN